MQIDWVEKNGSFLAASLRFRQIYWLIVDRLQNA